MCRDNVPGQGVREPVAVISTDDCLWFIDDALNGMVAIVSDLGDDLANAKPDVPGANSPFAVLTHCLGVMEFWAGGMIAGRSVVRDRDAEFEARGRVGDLVERARNAQQQLAEDVAGLDASAPPRRAPLDPTDSELPVGRTRGGALVHIATELTQHWGQMEITRDILRAPWARVAGSR
jgi:Protein of unknown function (DUF664)